MEAMTTGSYAATGAFRCEGCGYVLTLTAAAELPRCPSCDGERFVPASLFPNGRFARATAQDAAHEGTATFLSQARRLVDAPVEHLAFHDAEAVKVLPLARDWTRIGRSPTADIRFDDPTVSRRHALVVRRLDGVRILDDRSLNGIFVNGHRVEWRTLRDGDEIVVGRHRLLFLVGAAVGAGSV